MNEKSFIPEKEYYTIGEVSAMTGIPGYTLRHWEKEVKALTPIRKDAKIRLYRQQEIDLINEIKDLVNKQGLKLKGVQKHLNAVKRSRRFQPELNIKEQTLPDSEILKEIRAELQQVFKLLKE